MDRSPTHREFLVDANDDGLFRDGLVGPSMGVVLGVAIALALGDGGGRPVVAPRDGRWGSWPSVALWLLGFLDATYLAGPFHFGRHGGAAAYWAFVVGVAR